MSQGPFTNSFAQFNSIPTIFFSGKVQPETETFTAGGVTNTPPVPPPGSVQLVNFKVSKSRGEIGFRPAIATGFFPPGAIPPGYEPSGQIRIPILTSAMLTACLQNINTLTGVTYLGVAFRITGVILEDLN